MTIMTAAASRSPLARSATPAVNAAPPMLAKPAQPALELRGVSKGYGCGAARTEVLNDVNLSIAEYEFVAIVGFSGSGKTTLISLLAGLTEPHGGAVLKAGQPVRGPGPDRGVVFQSYSLMPWLSVAENVALAVDSVFAGGPDCAALARTDTTLVIYMGMKRLPEITAALRAAGMTGGTPAAAIQHGTTERQRSVIATLTTLADAARDAELGSPALIVIGRVVGLARQVKQAGLRRRIA